LLLYAAILVARYRASHRRPIICRDFKVVISPVGTSRINLCILVPAILYHNTPRSLVRQGTATRNGEYFGTPTSVFETRNGEYFGTYVGISDKERRVLWYTHVRNIAVLARFNHCTHGQTCTRAPVKIQTTLEPLLAVAFHAIVRTNSKKASRERHRSGV